MAPVLHYETILADTTASAMETVANARVACEKDVSRVRVRGLDGTAAGGFFRQSETLSERLGRERCCRALLATGRSQSCRSFIADLTEFIDELSP